jgi:hypothetical protein
MKQITCGAEVANAALNRIIDVLVRAGNGQDLAPVKGDLNQLTDYQARLLCDLINGRMTEIRQQRNSPNLQNDSNVLNHLDIEYQVLAEATSILYGYS